MLIIGFQEQKQREKDDKDRNQQKALSPPVQTPGPIQQAWKLANDQSASGHQKLYGVSAAYASAESAAANHETKSAIKFSVERFVNWNEK